MDIFLQLLYLYYNYTHTNIHTQSVNISKNKIILIINSSWVTFLLSFLILKHFYLHLKSRTSWNIIKQQRQIPRLQTQFILDQEYKYLQVLCCPFCQSDTDQSHYEEGTLSWETVSIRLACEHIYGAFSWLMMWEGPAHVGWWHPWVNKKASWPGLMIYALILALSR